MKITDEQKERYQRQIIIPEIGEAGQEKLLAAKILIIGAGGLGSPAAYYLTAAGIGTLGIADSDSVELSNLQRQILHTAADIKKRKTDSARNKLAALNPDLNLITLPYRIDKNNISSLIRDYDYIIDAADNFDTKFLINDACVEQQKPFSHAGVSRFTGQALTWLPGPSERACFRCIFKDPPDSNAVLPPAQAGILGTTAGLLGTIQACEAIKYFLGKGDLLTDSLLIIDTFKMDIRKINVRPRPGCICRINT